MRLDCGEFEIDEVTLKYPPHTVSIGAVSVPEASAPRSGKVPELGKDHTRSGS